MKKLKWGRRLRNVAMLRCLRVPVLVHLPVSKTVDLYCILEVNAMPFLNKHHTAEEYATPLNLRALPPVPLLFVSV